jgi:hypothetical protein
MADNFDQALEVDILAAALMIDRRESGDMLELLSRKLKLSLPQNIQVQRQWFGLGAIKTVTLCFDDFHYQISREPYGSITARVITVIRGVKIKTTEISTAEWSQAVAQALTQIANRNAQVRDALTKFVLG